MKSRLPLLTAACLSCLASSVHAAADPAEMTNLAGKPEHAAIQKKLSAELDRWLAARNDPDVPLDTVEAHSAAQRGQPIFPAKP